MEQEFKLVLKKIICAGQFAEQQDELQEYKRTIRALTSVASTALGNVERNEEKPTELNFNIMKATLLDIFKFIYQEMGSEDFEKLRKFNNGWFSAKKLGLDKDIDIYLRKQNE